MNQNLRISLDFVDYPDSELDEFADNVATNLTGSTAFPAPPVDPAALKTFVTTFHSTILAAAQGGLQLTAAKNAARVTLVDALRKEANYVQTVASHNLDVLLTSGFYANSTNRAQSPLDTPAIVEVDNLGPTQLLVRLTPMTNAKSYRVQTSTGTNGWQDAGIFTQARRIILGNLTSGTVYNIRAQAIGGSTGASGWSDPMSHIAT